MQKNRFKKFDKIHMKTSVPASFRSATVLKKTLAHVLLCIFIESTSMRLLLEIIRRLKFNLQKLIKKEFALMLLNTSWCSLPVFHCKINFSSKISLVNLNKSSVSCIFIHIYRIILEQKLYCVGSVHQW